MYDTDIMGEQFDFSMIVDPTDPLYEDEVKVQCFSHPITTIEVPDEIMLSGTVDNFLDPFQDNLEYQYKKPFAIW